VDLLGLNSRVPSCADNHCFGLVGAMAVGVQRFSSRSLDHRSTLLQKTVLNALLHSQFHIGGRT
jgi:hypothetical protein